MPDQATSNEVTTKQPNRKPEAIVIDILRVYDFLGEPLAKTRLGYQAGLGSKSCNRYVGIMLDSNLLERTSDGCYKRTEKGLELLKSSETWRYANRGSKYKKRFSQQVLEDFK